ncbi:MAG: phosphopantetheine-binding protein [Wolbachia pipientis]|jgi:acyl transferase domain-containing protein/acyl carrier protein|nr:phosphopantetheine-binding protein [Wolbachia pipientis]
MLKLEEIAVIGTHLRVSGAKNVNEFINNLITSTVSIKSFPSVKCGASSNMVNTKGILDDYDCFDAGFFNISDQEARIMDPQHRVILEAVVHALETAGISYLENQKTIGIFCSCSANYNYSFSLYENGTLSSLDKYSWLIGNDKDYLATRVAHKLNFTGPALTVQSGCSSSLVALHQACRSLQISDCDIAIVGGVSITLPMYSSYEFVEGMIYSKTGLCSPYSSEADGIVDGCGVGVIVLQKKKEAIFEKRNIWSIIHASAINNDGSNKASFLSPSVEQQIEVIRKALMQSNLNPKEIGYIEGHGTGTVIGDAMELTALDEVYGKDRSNLCYVGSVKANIGHLDAASGIIGFIKATLSVKQGKVFPQPNLSQVTNHIKQEESFLRFATQTNSWNDDCRYAAVTSLGVGGTNVHVIVSNHENNFTYIPLPSTNFRKFRYPNKLDQNITDKNVFMQSTAHKSDICYNTEQKILLAWNQTLGVNITFINEDNFFEQGGDSLLAVKLVNLVNKEIQVNLSPVVLFNYPKLKDLKAYIVENLKQKKMQEEKVYDQL